MKKFTPLSVLAMSVLAIAGCTKKDTTTTNTNSTAASSTEIVVGEVGSMTGSEATFGTSTHNGIALAFEQINAAGGVKGKKFKLITLDDQGKPDEAATAVTKLITQDKIAALLGEVASSRSLAMAPIAQSHGVPMITPSSTNPKVTEQGDYIFRVCFIDPFQGTVMAKFAKETLKIKNVAILRDVKNDYSVGLADFFTQTFTKNGGTIVVDQSYSAGDMDFKSQLTAIRAKKPDAIYVPGYYTEVGLIARQAKELGLDVPLMGGDGWDSPKLTEIGGKSIEGSYFSNHYSPEDQSPVVQKFIAEFKAKYGIVPDGLAAMGYDAAKVLADAMTRAPDLASTSVKAAIAATKEYPGVTGVITLNEHRDPVKSAVVLKVAAGGYKYQTTVKP
jgi:branched-chain amino acid transport system substrate-binding protein